MYAVKEIFYTLQGEGANAGRAAVFCRFAGCNLWSGLEESRAGAICDFCDTDFVGTDGVGGGKFVSAQALADAIDRADKESKRQGDWEKRSESNLSVSPCLPVSISFSAAKGKRLVVCTGGEPLLQMTEELVGVLHERGFEVAIETNGTKLPPAGIDWICVSPKANTELVLRQGNELKLIFPQPSAEPELYENLAFDHFFLQPMDGPHREANTRQAIRYCLEHPRWRLSLQTQKILGIK